MSMGVRNIGRDVRKRVFGTTYNGGITASRLYSRGDCLKAMGALWVFGGG